MQAGGVAAYGAHHFRETDCIRVEHRAATQNGEAVTIQVDEIDVGSALCDPLLQNLRPLIHQRIHEALDDFAIADVAPGDPDFGGVAHNHGINLGVRSGSAIAWPVVIPARAGFLSEPAHLAQAVCDFALVGGAPFSGATLAD